jgi:hypothetical protein
MLKGTAGTESAGSPRERERTEETEMPKKQKATLGRRAFLRTFGAGGTVIAVVPLGADARRDDETRSPQHDACYRETDHVKTFYRVNRYPVK